MPKQRYKLTIAYDGTRFHGWQEQTTPEGQILRTVQGVLQEGIRKALKTDLHVTGASRTDSGVHAFGQIAHMDVDTPIPVARMARAINSRLDPDLEVRQVEIVSPYFHAIRDAVDKQYRYIIWNKQIRPLHRRDHVYHYWNAPLELAPMQHAAKRLIGEYDFASFAAVNHGRQTTVRTIHNCQVASSPIDPQEFHITVSGSGFLYNMVRIISGTLLEVGRGHWGPEKIDELLAKPDRQFAGPTLPPTGLYLEWIKHSEQPLRGPEQTEGTNEEVADNSVSGAEMEPS